ncbi:MAG: histidine kinase, partial [Nocardia sp.]|nr:histidine kinase [Nocardia sp.]
QQRPGDLPQRGTNGNAPQRGSAPGGLPQRAANDGLPQRGQGLSGLPKRDPGAGLPPRPEPTPGLSLPRRTPQQADTSDQSGGEGRDRGRHSQRSNPEKTASFFQTRLQPAPDPGPQMGGTPIFAEMMSAWLADPSADQAQAAVSFESAADDGWQAARRAVEETPEKKTAAGLPQRDPGNRLVPGGVTGGRGDTAPRRNPESIRSSLSRHQQGVRDGRAMGAMNLTGDKGDR